MPPFLDFNEHDALHKRCEVLHRMDSFYSKNLVAINVVDCQTAPPGNRDAEERLKAMPVALLEGLLALAWIDNRGVVANGFAKSGSCSLAMANLGDEVLVMNARAMRQNIAMHLEHRQPKGAERLALLEARQEKKRTDLLHIGLKFVIRERRSPASL